MVVTSSEFGQKLALSLGNMKLEYVHCLSLAIFNSAPLSLVTIICKAVFADERFTNSNDLSVG